jgi:hypothetical protein
LRLINNIGGNNYDAAIKYITEAFLKKNKRPKKRIYVHVTCATDTGNIAAVFNAVKDIVLRETLGQMGLQVQ